MKTVTAPDKQAANNKFTQAKMYPKERFYGKYRGLVFNPIDPLNKGRVLATVTVGGAPLQVWAEACTPYVGIGAGFQAIPPAGTGVWIEFEEGDLDKPIWTGCWLNSLADAPTLARAIPPGVPGIVMQTPLQNAMLVSDVPGPGGGIMLRSATGATIMVNDSGIIIQNGQGASITMVGATVAINGAALTVT